MNRRRGGACSPYLGKRAFDLLLLTVLAVPAALIGAVCAAAVGCTSRGPVFFRQVRVGMGGREFVVWKFRTMIAGDNPIFPDASRITPVGAWLRRLSLDELPQLINVARGDMSIVGPRPTLPYQVARYDDRQRLRLCVRPGLTGLAQVRGRNALDWATRIEMDIEYVQTQSWRTDLRILAQTGRVVLSGEGAEGHPVDDPLAAPGAGGAGQAGDAPDAPQAHVGHQSNDEHGHEQHEEHEEHREHGEHSRGGGA